MKKMVFLTLIVTAALSSCSSDNELNLNQNSKHSIVFTATMENNDATRATYDEINQCALWELYDQISINGKAYKAQSTGAVTTFKADGEDAIGSTYNAYFACEYDGTTATLPANVTETWKDGRFNMPMYATSRDNTLQFKNLCGVLKITVKNSQFSKVKYITVSSANCATSGVFYVTDSKAVLSSSSLVTNTTTVTYTDAVSTMDGEKVFYIAIPPQTYKNLAIAVSDGVSTKVMITKKNQDVKVERNKIYPIDFIGKATIGEGNVKTDAGIPNNKMKWVQLWADGPKFAECNLGVTDGMAESYGSYYEQDVDIATSKWGFWRMPYITEFDDLLSHSDGEWIAVNGIFGRLYTGKGAWAANSVFLPAAGYCSGSKNNVYDQGSFGHYWSADGGRSSLIFRNGSRLVDYYDPYEGKVVRPVLE